MNAKDLLLPPRGTVKPPVRRRAKEIAYFDIEIGRHLRVFNMVLKIGPDGRPRSYAPKARGKRAASFHADLAQRITDAAEAALK
ncbi:hypothetical protein [Neorhizobium galegae]|uniref:hypothetical protein n=1 Tax=Neorhizobium galegae TaxID=399 RepID=UPI001287C582|nr:hypothetical protein [Neorhizobium galegae]KAA9382476.1 hypothetical protein F4V88_30910 [Neorhizobium galegae]MCM2501330.1 hypothetical protein [Neorhizobium galegae]MCQ1775207.1 hypothetical protein [Neorhizobium galegae]MCQ1799568.1 hypothetical protein [Neorhizobium galegae]